MEKIYMIFLNWESQHLSSLPTCSMCNIKFCRSFYFGTIKTLVHTSDMIKEKV